MSKRRPARSARLFVGVAVAAALRPTYSRAQPPVTPPTMLSVLSDSSCPSAESVRQALVSLLPALPVDPVTVELRSGRGVLSIDFRWGDGVPPETRVLPLPPDCQTRAGQAALVVATWLGSPRVEPFAPPALAPVSAPTSAPTLARAATPSSEPPADAAARRQTTIGVGVVNSAGRGWASGGRADVTRAPAAAGLGWGASIVATRPGDVSLAGGSSRWMVVSLAPVVKGRWTTRWLAAEVDAGPLATLAIGWGSGYDTNHADGRPSFGLTGGLRLLAHGRPFQPWIDARGAFWPVSPRLRVDAPGGTPSAVARLPTADLQLAIGMSVILP